MQDIYDAIIIGAGQTGTQCARRLAEKGYKVIILERQQEIGEPNFSTAGTPAETMEKFDLPKNLTPYSWQNFYLASPGYQQTFSMKKQHGYVFDFRNLRQWLAEKAAHSGAEIAVGTDVTDLIIADGNVTGVEYKGIISKGKLRSKIVIDATGNNAVSANKIIPPSYDNHILATGLELELMNVSLPVEKAIYCWLGDKFIPNGYVWAFPLSSSKVKVGVGRYQLNNKTYNLRLGLKSFIESAEWLKGGEPLEFHGGSLNFNANINDFVGNGFINLSNIANPLGGEGIRHGLQAAEFAASVAAEALEAGDFSKRKLQKYNELWLKYSDDNWKTCEQLTRYVYSNTSDERMDKSLRSISHLSGDDLFEVLFHYNFKKHAAAFAKSALLSKVGKLIKK